MIKKFQIILSTVILLLVMSCERPSSPDFELQQSFDIPLIKDTSYKLLGDGKGAIIDTTSENFKDLFVVGANRLVFLSAEIDFEIGDFDDLIPELEIDPTHVESEIGTLEIDDFSTSFESEIGLISGEPEELKDEQMEIGLFEIEFNASGRASFEQVTGLDPDDFESGDLVPGPMSETVLVELEISGFQRAEIESGLIRLSLSNDLGFDISNLTATLVSDLEGSPRTVGSTLELGSVPNAETRDDILSFNPGDELIMELGVEFLIEWEQQTMQASPGEISVVLNDEKLLVRNTTGTIRPQKLNPEIEPIESSNPDFDYAIVAESTVPEELYQLELRVFNDTELVLSDSTLTRMPVMTIMNSDGDVIDGPKELVNLSTPGAFSIGSRDSAKVVFNLAGQKLTRLMSYEISLGTIGGNGLTVDKDDIFMITSRTTELKLQEARSDIDPQEDIPLEDTEDVKGDFVNAEVEEGELRLEIQNLTEIPLVIDYLTFFNDEGFMAKNTGRFFGHGSVIAEIHNLEIPAMQTRNEIIPLENTGISNRISYTGTVSSPGSETPVTVRSTDLIRTELEGSVQLSAASAVLRAQSFSINSDVEIEDVDFRLTHPDHYVEIESGLIKIGNIINEIDLDVDTLIISFPGVLMDPDGTGTYRPADSLWIEFSGNNRIRRGSDTGYPQPEINQSLKNARLYALNNRLTYNVVAVTEDTRNATGADTMRTVRSGDQFRATFEVSDLNIRTAVGEVQKRVEFLGDDDGDDSVVDLFNDREAEVTELEDLREFSERLSGLRLINPGLDLIYDTNLGVGGTVVAAILGINDKGEEVFLSARPGSELEVLPDDHYHSLLARGSQIPRSNLLKFDIEPAQNIGEVLRNQVIRFDAQTTNVEDFLSNLPVEMRFIGNITVNPDAREGFLVNPIVFDVQMGIDIPINLSTAEGRPATFEDTLSTDLSDLPSPEDDVLLTEAVLYVMYENGLPFETGFTLDFLDRNKNIINTGSGQPLEGVNFRINAATVHPDTRFVSEPAIGMTEIRLTREQLDHIQDTRYIRLTGSLATSRDDLSAEVKVRADDFIGLSVNASFKTAIKVN